VEIEFEEDVCVSVGASRFVFLVFLIIAPFRGTPVQNVRMASAFRDAFEDFQGRIKMMLP
jgi:hypothetical protein